MSTLYAAFSYGTTALLTVGLATLAVATVRAAGRNEADHRFLRAIREIETGNNPRAIGIDGEFTAYQFTRETWRDYTNIDPVEALRNPLIADGVAEDHLEFIRRQLRRAGLEASYYNAALAWNAGIGATIRGEARPTQHDYAKRVIHLMEAFRK
ncbi:MAG: transglycosylase SLT domain-containing protein [Opitutaceae bacterium]|nr:transglycosylase SLT domain-containing protein [Opitutaceae bacterium]